MDKTKMFELLKESEKTLSLLWMIEENYEEDEYDVGEDAFNVRMTFMNVCSTLNEFLNVDVFMFNDVCDRFANAIFEKGVIALAHALKCETIFLEEVLKDLLNSEEAKLISDFGSKAYCEENYTLGETLDNLVNCGIDDALDLVRRIEE